MIATRGGKITDESDSDESDDEECANAFWLCLVVQKCQVADKDMTILNTNVRTGQKYIRVRWFEKDDDCDDMYVLSDAEACITDDRVKGLIPLKKCIGKIKKFPEVPSVDDPYISFKLQRSMEKNLNVLRKKAQ